jgi:hypothetical protein
MTWGFCAVTGSFGLGTGGVCLLVRFKPAEGMESSLRKWLCEDALPALPLTSGVGSAHLFEGTMTPGMTNEQRIRGADRGVDSALIITGYDSDAVAACANELCAAGGLPARGAGELSRAMYRWIYSLASTEVVGMPTNAEPLHPAPPFDAGSPAKAPAATLAVVKSRLAKLNEERRAVAERVGKKLGV